MPYAEGFIEGTYLITSRAAEVAGREIDLVREYRTRLIADVVTGRLDVRGVELPSGRERMTSRVETRRTARAGRYLGEVS